MRKINMIGFKSGKLTVISESEKIGKQATWLCQCECGNTAKIQGYELRAGNRTSCGKCTNIGNKQRKHGLYQSRIYETWVNMRGRCNNPNCKQYKDYGGRGIKVCKEWDDFIIFRDWALANGYQDNLTIDRIDNERGYSPDNCRWVDRQTQQNNRRTNVILEYDGEKHTLAEWSRIKGIPQATIRARLRYGWEDTEKILTKKNFAKGAN